MVLEGEIRNIARGGAFWEGGASINRRSHWSQIKNPYIGISVFFSTVRSAKPECTRATPGRRVRCWVWMRS